MLDIWMYSILSVVIVSIISFVGVVTLMIRIIKLKAVLMFLISFSIGALLGDSFIHLLPEAVEKNGFTFQMSLFVLFGIFSFFIVEKIVHWKHSHKYGFYSESKKKRSIAVMNMVGDGVHNFIDGVLIAVSYLVSIPLGIATTIAVVLHEIPQEFGDFGILIYGGFTKARALLFNFFTALTAVAGAAIALIIGPMIENFSMFSLPFAAGGLIYIASSNLMPELHKEIKAGNCVLQISGIVLGILVMIGLLYI